MATSIWRWRHITREKAPSTAPTEFPHSARHATTYRRFRTPTSGRGPAAGLTRLPTGTRFTETSHPKDASYLGTTENSNPFSVIGFQDSGYPGLSARPFASGSARPGYSTLVLNIKTKSRKMTA